MKRITKIKSIKAAVRRLVGKKVLVRVDFNVPIKDGRVADDYKIAACLPTIRFLSRYRCKVILASHLGRPLGKRAVKMSLAPVARRLEKILGKEIRFIKDSVGLAAGTAAARMKPGEIILLENLRFHGGEAENSLKFAKELAELADIYVNDALAVSHRKHASVSAIKRYLPAYAGLLLEEEVKNLSRILRPKKPLVIIVGGTKAATKIGLIKNLYKKADKILIGGAAANNFLKVMDFEIGKSLTDKKSLALARSLLRKESKGAKKIIFPVDVVVGASLVGENKSAQVKSPVRVSKSDVILDIGPQTIRLFNGYIRQAETIVWNGPLGMFEDNKFKNGTLAVALATGKRSAKGAFSLVGGGETIEALKKVKMLDQINWVSTGGGAMLAFLAGGRMPGLEGIVEVLLMYN